ncbi:MAG: hypothetical protein AB1798_02935 [Spirochaetota bacterium]
MALETASIESIQAEQLHDDFEPAKIDITTLKDECASIPPGIEYPVNLFGVLKKHMQISKGALLLLDTEQGMFIPLAITGFDKTTHHRLRLPGNLDGLIEEYEDSKVKIYPRDKLTLLRPYFSIREFAILEKALIFPFTHTGKLLSLLLIVESSLPDSDDELSKLFDALSPLVSPNIYASRFDKFNKLASMQMEKSADLHNEVKTMINTAEAAGNEMILLVITIENLISTILAGSQDADGYRVKNDILRILSAMVSGTGKVFTLDNDRLLFLISGKSVHNEKLLLHQIFLALKSFFRKINEMPELLHAVRKYPQDGRDAVTLLNGLLHPQ